MRLPPPSEEGGGGEALASCRKITRDQIDLVNLLGESQKSIFQSCTPPENDLPRFFIFSFLGSGAFGDVYEARCMMVPPPAGSPLDTSAANTAAASAVRVAVKTLRKGENRVRKTFNVLP